MRFPSYAFYQQFNFLYENDIKNYNKLLINNISKTYKKSDPTTFHVVLINYHPINLCLKILKIFTIVHFLTEVLKIKSNSTQIIKGTSVRTTTGKGKLYGSILHIAAMFPSILGRVF